MKILSFKNVTKLFVLLFLLSALLAGCGAYFNTFYNAKKSFEAGEKKRLKMLEAERKRQTSVQNRGRQRRRSAPRIQEFTKAIEKASKVLELYPKSKYVDDALMIIGKSFFYQQEYIKAQRKFNELLTAFPNSRYAPEARFLLGKTLLALDQYDKAEEQFTNLLLDKKNKKFFAEARLELGDMYFQQKLYDQAVQQYEKTINKIKDKNVRTRAQIRIGECYLQLGNFRKAAAAFRRVRKFKPGVELRYQAEMKYAYCLRKLGEFSKALEVYNRLLKLTLTDYEIGTVRLQTALTYEDMKDKKNALRTFHDIIDNYPRTAAAAEAYYYLGLYELNHNRDFDMALEDFQKAQKEYPNTDFKKEIKQKITDIKQLHELEDVIWALEDAYERKINNVFDNSDTLLVLGRSKESAADSAALDSALAVARRDSARADSLRRLGLFPAQTGRSDSVLTPEQRRAKARLDSLKQVRLKRQKGLKIPQKPEDIRKMLVQKDMQLAELFFFQLDIPDSALQEYQRLILNFPDNPSVPKALFTMAYIYKKDLGDTTKADSLYRKIIQEFPKTAFAQESRKILHLPAVQKADLAAENLFLQAEQLNFDQKKPGNAVKLYKEVWEKYPHSPYAPKALYAVAWIYENELNQGKQALKSYRLLAEKFSKTPYGSQAEKIISKVEQAQKALADSSKRKAQKLEAAKKAVSADSSRKSTVPDTSLSRGPNNRPAINDLNSFIKTKKKKIVKKGEAAAKKDTTNEAP